MGELQGQPEVVSETVNFRSMKSLSGKEQETARQTGADRQFAVEVWGNPKWKDLEQCWFEILPLETPPRKLHIEFVDDRKNNGLDLRIICGENL